MTKENTIKCELCGLVCSMQISASHLRSKHSMTTKEYRDLGYNTLSPARLEQLRQSPVGSGGTRRSYGKDHWNWKGGYVNGSGYKVISVGGVEHYEHRYIMENAIGRALDASEVVHHKDGNRLNNSLENLQLMSRKEHDKIKDETRAYFYTNQDCEEAAMALFGLGWSLAKIVRALRIHHNTLSNWLKL